MALKVSSFRVDVLDDKYDFNWAKFSFSQEIADGGDFGSSIEVRVPKSITDLPAIKTYALDRIRKLDLTAL
jgi:hypothetical protein